MKLKRKKFIPLIILAAFLFPIPLTYLMTTPSMMERYTDRADAFDGLFNMVLGYGIQFLLPCIIGVIAAILFFMERDNDTFKNLRTIPVTSTQMVLAKIIVLFLFGIVFCVASTIATILCGFGTLEVYGIGYKLFLAVETGIFITAGTLPLIVLVVFFACALAIGIGFGVSVPAFQCLFVNVAPHHMRGTATSTYLTSFDFGMGIGMLSAGFIATHTNLATAYGVGAVCCLLSLFVYIRLVKASYERNKLIS